MGTPTKNNLIEAFLVLAKEQKNLDFTVSELCKKAGYTRATFYRYFQTFDDVLRAINDDVHKECYTELTKFDLKDVNLDILLDIILPALYKKREILRIIYRCGCEYQWTGLTLEKYWTWAKNFAIKASKNTGAKSPELFFSLQLKQIQSIIYNWLLEDNVEKPKEVKARVTYFLSHSFIDLMDLPN